MNNKKRKKFCQERSGPWIDNSAPYFPILAYLKAFKLRHDFLRVRSIDEENMMLLKKMNIVNRMGGQVKCWTPYFRYKTKFDDQDRRNKILMHENSILLKKINQASSVYPARALLKQWKSRREIVEHRTRFISVLERMTSALEIQRLLAERSQTKCFFDIGLKEEDQVLGRIVFELYDTIVPHTCENFVAFCRGVNGFSYKNTPFHRIVTGLWCQGGDVTKFNGTGGMSIYGDSFERENFKLHHAEAGILSMCNNDKNRNDSKFNLTFRRLETVTDRVVFGRVIHGLINIYKIEEFGTKTGKPIKSVIVLNCGILSKCEYEKLSELQ